MWFITFLIGLLIALLLIVIMNTSMKLALMITTLYRYDTKKLFIPALLAVALWGLMFWGCFNTINKSLDNNAVDILFSMIFDTTMFESYKAVLIKPILYTFIIGTILQSFTYYTVNINYQKIGGTVRFSLKEFINKISNKLFNKTIFKNKVSFAISEVTRGPKKLTFFRAVITSLITILITLLVCFILYKVGTVLSYKLLSKF